MSQLLLEINRTKKPYAIRDIAELKYGFALPERDRQPGQVPVYGSSGIVGFHSTQKVDKPAIIVGRKGNVGSLFFSDVPSYPIDTAYFIDDPKEGFDLKFVYYLLQRINLPRYGGDSAVPGLGRESVYNLEVATPDLPSQKKIAEILGTYDAKIEVNNAMIKNLETMTQTIFNEWFVKFKFPGHEKIGMIDSEIGHIPEGWAIAKIKNIAKTTLGGTPSRDKSEYWGGNIPWINSGEVNKLRVVSATEFITELGLKNSNARIMKIGTTLIAITGATLGQVSRLEIESTANQSVVGIFDENGIMNEYLYLYIKTNILDLISGASGGAQQHINKQMVENYHIVVPNTKILTIWNESISPMFTEIRRLIFENVTLQRTRDQLLSKLI